ncbi:MAG TPA: trehalose-phosphatase [Caulobacteraceae bacterium]|nr:trehalose-phosphatase [Caulobacteraceae bacterium]
MTIHVRPRRTLLTSLQDASLFLDLDGTLATIMPRPEAVSPAPARTALITRACSRLKGRLAIVSGRAIAEVDRITEAAAPCVAGEHGLQRRLADGSVLAGAAHPALADAKTAFEAVARARFGLQVEQKPMSIALHYRGAPGAEAAVRELAVRLSETHGLTLQEGAMVAELRTPGPDKGETVRAYMAEPPFRGSTPIFVGDDLTDEAGFAAAAELGGYGVLVGPSRETAAPARLEGPEAVLAWLHQGLATGVFAVEADR